MDENKKGDRKFSIGETAYAIYKSSLSEVEIVAYRDTERYPNENVYLIHDPKRQSRAPLRKLVDPRTASS